jgi:hypothetical protein
MRLRHDIVRILRADAQAPLEFVMGGRQNEHADEIFAHALLELLRALPVDVEQHVLAGGQRVHHRLFRRAVEMIEDGGIFEELAGFDRMRRTPSRETKK